MNNETISFTLNGTSEGTATTNSSGVATRNNVSLDSISVGTHNGYIGASFAGDSNYEGSNATPATLTVTNAATSLNVSSVTGTYGGTVSLTATLTSNSHGVSGETISFTLNGTDMGTATTDHSGVATLNNVSLAGIGVGTYNGVIEASFAGDSTYASSDNTANLTVNKADTSLVVASASGVYGGTVNLTATLSPAVQGETISFTLHGTAEGTATTDASGVATLDGVSLGTIAAGEHDGYVGASFAGDSNYKNSSGTATLAVYEISPTSGPAAGGTLVTITGADFGSSRSDFEVGSVTFGSTLATSLTWVSDSTITCKSPAGTGTVTVTVTYNNVGEDDMFSNNTFDAGTFTYNQPVAANIVATSGTPQSATVGTAFSDLLVATVTDSGGNPVSGVTVTFTAPGSGASGTFATTDTAVTGANGEATSDIFTANDTAGAYSVSASVVGVETPASFSLTNLAGTAFSIVATSGTPQSATVGTAFSDSLVATVTDSYNNPVSGVTVTFTAPGSGASGTFATTDTAVTGANGEATSDIFTANDTAGAYSVSASVVGVETPASFSLTNLAGTAFSIVATSGTPQSATVGTAFGAALVATVTDSYNNPVSGVTVTFTAPGSGASGTFANATVTDQETTDSNGVATSTTFTANNTAGAYSVTASVVGVETPASFSLTNLADIPVYIVATSGTPQSATVGTAFGDPLVATVTDSDNNPVSGVTVTFTAPGSGASGTFANATVTDQETTDSNGVATSSTFTANDTAGTYSVTASMLGGVILADVTNGAEGVEKASFSLTNLAATAANIVATSGTPQSTTVGTAFSAPLVATVTDSYNNPISGVTVTFTAPGSGTSGTFATTDTAVTGTNGEATSDIFTANSTAGAYSVTASVVGVETPASFSLTNLAATAANIVATSGTPQSATEGTAFSAPLVATVTDSSNNPVSGVTVTFTAPGSGASGTFANATVTDQETTDSNGVATSTTFTANNTAGAYSVTAGTPGVDTPASFSLTNSLSSVTGGTQIQLTVQTISATNPTTVSASLNGSIAESFGVPVNAYGFYWGTGSMPTTQVQVGTDNHTGAFTYNLSGLTAGTSYCFEAYAHNQAGLTTGQVLTFTTTVPAPPPVKGVVFTDVPPSFWAYADIENLSSLGIMSGYSDGTFRPNDLITRAEFCTAMDKLLNLTTFTPQTPTFTDVNSSDWFYNAVEAAVYAGIAKGYNDGTFRPEASISRQEIACVLVQALGKSQLANANSQAATSFADDNSIAWWSRGFVYVAMQQGIIGGYSDDSFDPGHGATRAEVAVMISNFLKVYSPNK